MNTLEAIQEILNRKQPIHATERIDQMIEDTQMELGYNNTLVKSKIELLEAVNAYLCYHGRKDAISTLEDVVKTIKESK